MFPPPTEYTAATEGFSSSARSTRRSFVASMLSLSVTSARRDHPPKHQFDDGTGAFIHASDRWHGGRGGRAQFHQASRRRPCDHQHSRRLARGAARHPTVVHLQLEAFAAQVVDGASLPLDSCDAVENMGYVDEAYRKAGMAAR